MTVIFEARQKNLRPILQDTGALHHSSERFQALSVYASALADEIVKR